MRNFGLLVVLFLVGLTLVTEVSTRRTEKRDVKSKSDSDDDFTIFDIIKGIFTKIKYSALGRLAEARDKRAEKQKQVLTNLYTSIIWPKGAQIALAVEAGNYSAVSNLVTQDVTGRIHPLGRFDSYVSVSEYFHSLAGPLPGIPTAGLSRVVSVQFDRPIFCTQNQCAYHVIANFKDFDTNKIVTNYTQIGYVNFNSKNQICSYEFSFLGLERTTDGPENPAYRAALVQQICGGIQALCTGVNQQFANFTACLNFMNTIPYGGWGQGDQNNQVCRLLHLQLVAANPATHCPHTGPSGGGKCIFHPETSYFGEGFDNCRDKNW